MEKKMMAAAAVSLLALPLLAKEKPNVILIMTDDLGWGDVGFNGNEIIRTPCLDDLASQGVVFDRFYTGCAVSSPTRASVLTGRNPFRTGVFHANTGILRPEEETLPELMKEKGYMTGHFGKWHLGTLTYTENDANRGRPTNKHLYNVPAMHGYDDSFVTESKVPTYDPMIRPAGPKADFWDYIKEGEASENYGTSYWRHDGTKETENLSGDDSRVIMDRVLPFIDRALAADKPFLSVVWFHAPHLPCVAGPEYAEMYKDYSLEERNYYGCISAMDAQVGRLVRYLKEKGIYENTILCFCSDNGPERNTPGVTGGLKERKRSLHEGGVRVPSFVVWAGHYKGGRRSDRMTGTYDYLPTFQEILKLRKPAYELDGESMVPALKKDAPRKNPVVIAIRNQVTVVEQQYKLYYSLGKYELYDIQADPYEEHDLSAQLPETVARMDKIMREHVSSFKASFMGEEYGTDSYKRTHQKWEDVLRVPER